MRSIRACVCTLIAGLSGALSSGCAGNGEGLDESGRPVESGPPAADDFTRIQDTIFTPICTTCHSGAAAPRGLRLDEGNSFALLVGVPSAEDPAVLRVEPGDPGASYLVRKIEGTASSGERMPLGGPPLPQESIDLVRQWIAAGASPPAAAASEDASMKVMGTIPEADEISSPTTKLTVIFNHPVDGSLANPEFTTLAMSGGDGSFSEGNETLIAPRVVSVSVANPTVMTLEFEKPLAPDAYQLRLRGTGALALADVSGRVLDGDADGKPGGDYSVAFSVTDEPLQDGDEQ